MIRWIILLSFVTVTLAEPCRIRLLNGDLLYGVYLGQDAEMALFDSHWQHEPLRIHGKYIESIDFGRKSHSGDEEWEIDLGNEQRVVGDVTSLTDGKLGISSSRVGSLEIDKKTVKKVFKNFSASQLLYRGPMNLNKWRFETLRGNSGILKPDQARLTSAGMELLQMGSFATLLPSTANSYKLRIRMRFEKIAPLGKIEIQFYSLPDQNQIPNPLQFSVEPRRLRLRAQGGNTIQEEFLFPLDDLALRENVSFELSLEVDKDNKRFRILLDQNLISEWVTPEWEFPQEPRPFFLTFRVDRDGFSKLVVEDIIFSERQRDLPLKTNKGLEDRETVRFVNGDVLPLKWEGVSPMGKWYLGLPEAETSLEMDTERLEQWKNSERIWVPIKRKANHVHIQLAGGRDRFMAELLGADEEGVLLKREGITSEFRISLSMIERIGFNPYLGSFY